MSNIHSLALGSSSDAARARGDNEEFFGGGATSGTAVWRPTNGPQRQQPGAAGGDGGGGAAGGGSGGAPDMRQIIQQARDQSASASSADDRLVGVITIYSNGFTLGSGDFRDARDSRNAAFIEALKAGEVPAELEALCRTEWGPAADTVRVSLVDRSSQVFVPPKPKFSFAESKGQQLASAAPHDSSAGQSVAALARQTPARYVVQAGSPTTTLQLVTADRRKHRETFNEDATIAQLYAHVASVAPPPQPQSAAQRPVFELVAGFPAKTLTEGRLTLKQAGICNASVQQRYSGA